MPGTTKLDTLKGRLAKVEKELEKVRGASPIEDGWQTQRLARKQRKWDELAKEKWSLMRQIEEYTSSGITEAQTE